MLNDNRVVFFVLEIEHHTLNRVQVNSSDQGSCVYDVHDRLVGDHDHSILEEAVEPCLTRVDANIVNFLNDFICKLTFVYDSQRGLSMCEVMVVSVHPFVLIEMPWVPIPLTVIFDSFELLLDTCGNVVRRPKERIDREQPELRGTKSCTFCKLGETNALSLHLGHRNLPDACDAGFSLFPEPSGTFHNSTTESQRSI